MEKLYRLALAKPQKAQ